MMALVMRLGLVAWLICVNAWALDPQRTIAEFLHTRWTAEQGAPTSAWSMAQTTDGYLWFGTEVGLARFDGIRFENYEPRRGQFPSRNISALLATPNGGLWIGFRFGGASFLKDGTAVTYMESQGLPSGTVFGLDRERNGTIWAATNRGLFRFQDGQWQDAGEDWGVPAKRLRTVFVDREGGVWAAGDGALSVLQPGAHRFQFVVKTTPRHTNGGNESVNLCQARDGTVWISGSADGLWPVSSISNGAPLALRVLPPSQSSVVKDPNVCLVDRDGGMWIATWGFGIARIPTPNRLDSVQRMTHASGFSADAVFAGLEDRERNIWFATEAGVERISSRSVVALPKLTGSWGGGGMVTDDDGVLWVASQGAREGEGNITGPLNRIQNDKLSKVPGVRKRLGCAFRDWDGTLWFGGPEQLLRQANGRLQNVAMPPDLGHFDVQAITRDGSGDLWISVVQHGVFRLHHGMWQPFGNLAALPQLPAVTMWTDSQGRTWFGYTENRVALLEGQTVRVFAAADGLQIGNVTAISGGSQAWFAGEWGLARFDKGKFQMMGNSASDGIGAVSGIVETPNGDLWLNQGTGVAHIPASELTRKIQDPGHVLSQERFDIQDGVSGFATQLRPQPSAILGTDGRIWLSGSQGLSWIDPAHIHRNPLPPPVAIRSVTASGRSYEPPGAVTLPALPSNVEIDYTALSLTVPDRVRFRYQLEGYDKTWQDVGTRRVAFYNRLGPGHYRFHVIACNNDGVWNQTGAAMELNVPPAFFQTATFRVLCVAAAGAALWLIYLLRVRQVALAVHGRLEERLAERERIARELHDTLLQSVQGLIWRFQGVAAELGDDQPARHTMETALDLAEATLTEGRDRVKNLRSSEEPRNELSRRLASAAEDLSRGDSVTFRIVRGGLAIDLRPMIEDEVYRIAREALANAYRHAHATEIEARIDYLKTGFQLRISDNGHGIDPEILRVRREDHWGIAGMCERARKIGGDLEITGDAGRGTEIEFRIPARIAYQNSKGSWSQWLRRWAGVTFPGSVQNDD